MLQAIAIDDEPAALAILTRYAEKVPFLQLTHTFVSPTEALAFLHTHTQRVDVIFLDIRMPDLSGTEFARLIRPLRHSVILTTAYPHYALEGYALEVLDYLLKPIEFSRFLQACNRAYTQRAQQGGEPSSIFVKDGYDWVRVELNEVRYIQSDTNLLFIYEGNRQISTRMTMADMLASLPPEQFMRVHKSYIVALRAIRRVERHQLTVGDVLIPLAGSYRHSLEQRLWGNQ